MIFSRASLKRSSRTRTGKRVTAADTDIARPVSGSSVLVRRKSRPPPLQIIPELSEHEFDIGANRSPATARPSTFVPPSKLVSSRTTLSAYAFSIDDGLLMFGGDTPRSPALSVSSSTSGGASSEGVPNTPGASDDEDGQDSMLPTPCLCPRRISIHPLCITKTRSLICQGDGDIHPYLEREDKAISLLVSEEMTDRCIEARAAMEAMIQAEQDFYTREFKDFISFSPLIPSPTSPARRDSLILVAEALPSVIEVPEPEPRGRSRHSKPLPLLPPVTPPISSFPLIPTFSLVQTTAQKSVVRRKRNHSSLPGCPPPPPTQPRPLPRTAVPIDIEDIIFPEEDFDVPSCRSIVTEQVHDAEEDANVYSQPSFTHPASNSTQPLLFAIPETPMTRMYDEVALSRSSTDSDAPRSSVDSTSSFASSTSSNTPISPFRFSSSPSSADYESTQCLCSRWSSSTLASLNVEPTRTGVFSPLKNVLGSRVRRIPYPPHKISSQMLWHPAPPEFSKNRNGLSMTPSPPSTPGKHVRGQGSRSSASSAGTSSSECNSHDGSPSGLKRKPIPMLMFLRGS